MAEKKSPLGATGRAAAQNVRRLREEQHQSVAELSRRMTDLGRPIATLGINRIEAGDRRIDVDDLVALAVALDVSPIAILLPPVEDGYRDLVEVTAIEKPVTLEHAWQFFEGFRSPNGTLSLEFVLRSRPRTGVASPGAVAKGLSDLQYERRIRTNGHEADASVSIGHLEPWDDDGND